MKMKQGERKPALSPMILLVQLRSKSHVKNLVYFFKILEEI